MKAWHRAIRGALLCVCLSAALVPGVARACAPASSGLTVKSDGVALNVRVLGTGGPPVLFIPSIGRGVEDFDALAGALVQAGFVAILPTPRGVGANLGALASSTLDDLTSDALAVAKAVCGDEPAAFVGQAYGSRIARMAAARGGARVSRLVLINADDGQPVSDALRSAMSDAIAQGLRSERARLEGLKTAFFAKGNDARVWLKGWYPLVAAAQNRAAKQTAKTAWMTGGGAPALIVQGEQDPVQPPEAGKALAALIGARATLVFIPQASHALLPEQPEAVAAVVLAYLQGKDATDRALIEPLVRNREGRSAARIDGAAGSPGVLTRPIETSPLKG